MNTYGQGPCPHCGGRIWPIILGAEIASYEGGGVMFEVEPPAPCPNCGESVTAFTVEGISTHVMNEIMELSDEASHAP